jgi:hypothetical protein
VRAHAAGGGTTTLVFPSIVNARLMRTQAALDRATKYTDQGQTDKAVAALTAANNNMSAAWAGAKYVIQTAPPPAAAAAFHKGAFRKSGRIRFYKGPRGKRVHQAGGAPAAGTSPYASQYDTAFAVLSLQHYAATTAVGLIPDTNGTTLTAVRSTLARAVNDRDAAIAYIHSVDPGPASTAAKVRAHRAGGAPAAGDWTTTMPNVVPLLDDEIQQVDGTMQQPGLSPAQTSILMGAQYRDMKTKNTVNQYWPPAPPAA